MLRLLHDRARFLPRLFADQRTVLLELSALGFQCFTLGFHRAQLLRQLGCLLLRNAPLFLRAGQNVLKRHVLVLQILLRLFDDLVVQPEAAADLERVGLSGNADIELVRRAEPVDVKLHRRVLHALVRQRKRLDLAVMRGGERRCARLLQIGKDRLRERRALIRVGACAELVEQNERLIVRFAQDADEVGHVRGERGQRLLDRLFVADVRKDLAEHRDLAALVRRNEHAGARHQRKQTDGFERDRFAAGVGSGDDQRVVAVSDPNGDRHDDVFVDQRMSAVLDVDDALSVELGTIRAHVARHDRAGKDAVKRAEQQQALIELVRIRRDQRGQAGKDALDLALLLRLQLLISVAQFDDRARFDENRLSAAALVVDQPADLRAVLRLDGDRIAAVAHGDDRLLQVFLICRTLDDAVELVLDALRRDAHLAADPGKLGRSVVRDLVLGENAAFDLLLDHAMRGKRVCETVQFALFVAGQQRFARSAAGFEALLQIEQFLRRERISCADALQRGSRIRVRIDRRASDAAIDRVRFPRLPQKHFGAFEIVRRNEGVNELAPDVGRRMGSALGANFVKFQTLVCSFVHGCQ